MYKQVKVKVYKVRYIQVEPNAYTSGS